MIWRIDGEEAWDLNMGEVMGEVIVISLQNRMVNGEREREGRIHAMAYSIVREEEVWTRTMARLLKRLDLPLALSFGVTAFRRRV